MLNKYPSVSAGLCLLLVFAVSGCKRSSSSVSAPTPVSNYFQTDFQNESEFIVENTVADLAEQVYYAKFNRLPDPGRMKVSATEIPGSSFSHPTYDLVIKLDDKLTGLTNRLEINGPIWSPEVYDGVVKLLAGAVGLPGGASAGNSDTKLLARLTDGTAATIEKENERLSAALADDFGNAALHEQAAVLLGAFTLREHTGYFYEIRSPLCRMTAHLAMARYLAGDDLSDINGRMAGVMLLTLMNNQAPAVAQLAGFKTNDTVIVSWVRALQARNTRDYRPLEKLDGLSPIECIAWFYALDRSANTDIAWNKLSDVQKRTVDFVRIADEGRYSVGTGHDLLPITMLLEFEEIGTVYGLSHRQKLQKDGLVAALNQMPDRCFSNGSDGQTGVHIIGWGLWAGFLQRQLCLAMQENFNLLQRKWGVPDDAREFSTNCDASFGGLRLYPFVRRFNCTDVAAYHQSVDDGFKVTVATPQLVSPECWNYLCYEFKPGERYQPNPNPHVNEWHNHNPPPGTAYDPHARLNHPSLINRSDAAALFDQLHELAPYDGDIAWYIWNTRYQKSGTHEQALALFQPTLDYDIEAMKGVANTVQDQPAEYEKLMAQAAALDPSCYFTLANYHQYRHEDDLAAADIEKGNALDPDSVTASYYADWLINYYLRHGKVDAARQVADFAGDVYSAAGLVAKADFFEATHDYSDAFIWYAKDEDRYGESGVLIDFCLRYKAQTGDTRYDEEVQQRLGKLFPGGIVKATLADFQSPPPDGVVIKAENDLIHSAGLHQGDVIVAVFGIRVHNFNQYNYGRQSSANPELDLIVWQGGQYHEIKTSPPNHRFGVDFGDYPVR